MNDEKYMYFTERIQNTLLKPEILKLMGKNKEQREDTVIEQKVLKEEEKKMTQEDRMKRKMVDHEKRKKARVEMLHIT